MAGPAAWPGARLAAQPVKPALSQRCCKSDAGLHALTGTHCLLPQVRPHADHNCRTGWRPELGQAGAVWWVLRGGGWAGTVLLRCRLGRGAAMLLPCTAAVLLACSCSLFRRTAGGATALEGQAKGDAPPSPGPSSAGTHGLRPVQTSAGYHAWLSMVLDVAGRLVLAAHAVQC